MGVNMDCILDRLYLKLSRQWFVAKCFESSFLLHLLYNKCGVSLLLYRSCIEIVHLTIFALYFVWNIVYELTMPVITFDFMSHVKCSLVHQIAASDLAELRTPESGLTIEFFRTITRSQFGNVSLTTSLTAARSSNIHQVSKDLACPVSRAFRGRNCRASSHLCFQAAKSLVMSFG